MTLLPRLCLLLALLGLVPACLPGSPGQRPDDVTPNAVAGDAIEVTALDAPVTAPAPASAGALPDAPQQGAAPAPAAGAPVPAPLPNAEDAAAGDAAAGDETEAAAAPTDEPPAEALPAPDPKSERQIACERKRGTWADTGGGLRICVLPTGDGGKRCTRESQCEGSCLARSGTCAPVEPLLGCNDILQDDGARATLCIE
jgi:hypothetical protein